MKTYLLKIPIPSPKVAAFHLFGASTMHWHLTHNVSYFFVATINSIVTSTGFTLSLLAVTVQSGVKGG